MWTMDSITILKKSNSQGEASVKLVDDHGTDLVLNKISIDINDGSSPVQVVKFDKVNVIHGALVEELKVVILEVFEAMDELGPGLYVADEDGIDKL